VGAVEGVEVEGEVLVVGPEDSEGGRSGIEDNSRAGFAFCEVASGEVEMSVPGVVAASEEAVVEDSGSVCDRGVSTDKATMNGNRHQNKE
jgi:hypothetical protein